MTNSRAKGKRGELEASKELQRIFGVPCRRGIQFQGGPESPDVCGLAGIHCEVKRVEAFNAYNAIEQAIADAGTNTPLVLHKRNRGDWLAVVRLDDLPELVAKLFTILAEKNS